MTKPNKLELEPILKNIPLVLMKEILSNLDMKQWATLKSLSKTWYCYFFGAINAVINENQLHQFLAIPFFLQDNKIHFSASHIFFIAPIKLPDNINLEDTSKIQAIVNGHIINLLHLNGPEKHSLVNILLYLKFVMYPKDENLLEKILILFTHQNALVEQCKNFPALAYLILQSPLKGNLPLFEQQIPSKLTRSIQASLLDPIGRSAYETLFYYFKAVSAGIYIMGKNPPENTSIMPLIVQPLVGGLTISFLEGFIRYFMIHLIKDSAPRTVKTRADEFVEKKSSYTLAKCFNTFFHPNKILNSETANLKLLHQTPLRPGR